MVWEEVPNMKSRDIGGSIAGGKKKDGGEIDWGQRGAELDLTILYMVEESAIH